MNRRLRLTDAIEDALAAIAEGERAYLEGASYSAVEQPKIALADVVLHALRPVEKLPRRAVTAIVDCELRPTRRRRA